MSSARQGKGTTCVRRYDCTAPCCLYECTPWLATRSVFMSKHSFVRVLFERRMKLSTGRVSSSIPFSDRCSDLPAHQQNANTTWQYPSEQMFYNAILRKGWQVGYNALQRTVGRCLFQDRSEWIAATHFPRSLGFFLFLSFSQTRGT